ncbi:hypothetical protein [Clostridium sp. C105KSO13]|uniref:hypothetical protein n=1 Tax=Clostridium sp. C105KSO13 TaxID=1776045 RepID=UPI000A6057D2|nr:hypothetical protein [Clostridium sp. C105KSO13]
MKSKKYKQKRASAIDAHLYNLLDKLLIILLIAGVLVFIFYPLLCIAGQSFKGQLYSLNSLDWRQHLASGLWEEKKLDIALLQASADLGAPGWIKVRL